jgi:uncharacterized membrane protein
MKTTLLAGILAAVSAAAQPTGDWGRAYSTGGMMGGTMYGVGGILMAIFWVGLTLLVWLWVVKLWRELKHKK